MSVSVTERHSEGEYTPGASASRIFDVHDAATVADVLAEISDSGGGLPSFLSTYPGDNRLFFLDRPTVSLNGPKRWVVRIRYAAASGNGEIPPPGATGLQIRWSNGLEQAPVDVDIDDKAILNSARNAFDPPPQRRVFSSTLTIVRTEPSYDPLTAKQFEGSVNSDVFNVAGVGNVANPGNALCVGFEPTGSYRLGDTQVEVAYVFELRDGVDPFQPRIPDMGTEAFGLDGDGNKVKARIHTRGPDPQPVGEPVPLNGLGRPYSTDLYQVGRDDLAAPMGLTAPPGATIEDTGEAVFLRYDVQPSRLFSELQLDVADPFGINYAGFGPIP